MTSRSRKANRLRRGQMRKEDNARVDREEQMYLGELVGSGQ